MKKIVIDGNKRLSGTIKIGGAKNSVVALIPAAILCSGKTKIYNVPDISDTSALIDIIDFLGCSYKYENEVLDIDSSNIKNKIIPEEKSAKLRASYYFMGALLGRFGKAEVFFPGGCNIGARPINLHLKGFEKLGAKVTIDGDKYIIEAEKLKGNKIYLDVASVGATINIMLAAVYAKGKTIISNAAKEPEIVNIASFLNNMGAKINGAGTSEISIDGVSELNSAVIEVIPDRIEAGTYILAGALMGDKLKIDNIIYEHIEALISKLKEMQVDIDVQENSVIVSQSKEMKAINVKTLVYPGFPTDLGQPMSVLLTQATGMSILEETVWENRMGHVKYLQKMGATIKVNGQTEIIVGSCNLKGQEVEATDLRAGAAMVLAGLAATGITKIGNIDHILRGYEKIIEKLSSVGASICIEEIK